jgi:hypothetical protein
VRQGASRTVSRPIDRAVDIIAFSVIGVACAVGLVWGRDDPYIVGLVILGLSVESWYAVRFIRARRRTSPRSRRGGGAL